MYKIEDVVSFRQLGVSNLLFPALCHTGSVKFTFPALEFSVGNKLMIPKPLIPAMNCDQGIIFDFVIKFGSFPFHSFTVMNTRSNLSFISSQHPQH